MTEFINPDNHGMVIVLDGDLAQVYDEGNKIRFITDLEVKSLSEDISEVTIKKIVPKGNNPLTHAYNFTDFKDFEEESTR